MVFFFKFGFFYFLSIFGLFFFFFWFKDVSLEGSCGFHTFFVQDGLKLGFCFFLFREVIFFFGIFWFFFDSSLVPLSGYGGAWSPLGSPVLNPFSVPLLNTFFLLSRGVSVTWSHFLFFSSKDCFFSLVFTCLLALVFIYMQAFEYIESFFDFRDGSFGAVFYLSTGFHGFHVFLGLIFLSVNFFFLFMGGLGLNHCLCFDFSIMYWHFVDVVWLFLFIFVYWWSFYCFILF